MALNPRLTALAGTKSVGKSLLYDVEIQNTSGSDVTLTSCVVTGNVNAIISQPVFEAPGLAGNYPTVPAGGTVNYTCRAVFMAPYGPDDSLKADVTTTATLTLFATFSDGAANSATATVTLVPVLV